MISSMSRSKCLPQLDLPQTALPNPVHSHTSPPLSATQSTVFLPTSHSNRATIQEHHRPTPNDIADLDAILTHLNQAHWTSHDDPASTAAKSVRTTDPFHAYLTPEWSSTREPLHMLSICPTEQAFDQPQLYALTPATPTASIQDFDTLILDTTCASSFSGQDATSSLNQSSSPLPLFDHYTDMSMSMDLMEPALFSPYSPDASNHSMSDDCTKFLEDSANMEPASPNTLLCSTQDAEQSFIFDHNTDGYIMPIKTSQDYGDEFSILEEVNHISEHGFYFPQGTPCKSDTDITKLIGLTEETADGTFDACETTSGGNNASDDTPNYIGDVMFSAAINEQQATANPNQTYTQSKSSVEEYTINYANQITPAASPASPNLENCKEYEDTITSPCVELNTEQNFQPEFKHSWIKAKQQTPAGKLRNCKRRLDLNDPEETINCIVIDQNGQVLQASYSTSINQQSTPSKHDHKQPDTGNMRVPPLKLKLTPAVSRVLEPISVAVNTPDIEFDLEMETEMEFDLIKFINSTQQENNDMASSIEHNLGHRDVASDDIECHSPPSPSINPEVPSCSSSSSPARHSSRASSSSYALSAPLERPRKRQRLDTYEDPGSVQSDSSASQASSSVQPKRRGRPPKTHSTPVSPSFLKNLNESDVRYFQMRNKNNEASRRSRINRKGREQLIEDEANDLEHEHDLLVARERHLEEQCKLWKKRLFQMVAA